MKSKFDKEDLTKLPLNIQNAEAKNISRIKNRVIPVKAYQSTKVAPGVFHRPLSKIIEINS